MGREQRLTRAYQKARIEQFDDASRYVFMSDCHRGDGSLSDEFTRNENSYLYALEYYFARGFTYVEAGDGNELWEYRQFKVIRRAHADVFASIKRFFDEGRLILLWGNHDNSMRKPKWVERNLSEYYDAETQSTHELLKGIQPHEAMRLSHRQTGQELLIVHGHQGDFVNDQAWFVAMIALRFFWRYLHAFGARNPASPAMNSRKRGRIERDYHEWITRHRTPLICGHTHLMSYPRRNEAPYFNAGSCVNPTSITAIELEDGAIALVRWHVVTNTEGVLQVSRKVLHGPRPIGEFDLR